MVSFWVTISLPIILNNNNIGYMNGLQKALDLDFDVTRSVEGLHHAFSGLGGKHTDSGKHALLAWTAFIRVCILKSGGQNNDIPR